MKTRTDLLNHLATKHNLKRYLEIGVQNPAQNFDKIQCGYKIGVDPAMKGQGYVNIIGATSDEYFAHEFKMNESMPDLKKEFDLIFIDGLHTSEQVQKDFENALKILSPNGFICLHDCNPLKEEHTIVPRPTERGHWNGDVYKFAISIRNKITIDIDNGCLVFSNRNIYECVAPDALVSWVKFNQHRTALLNLISWNEFVAIGSYLQ